MNPDRFQSSTLRAAPSGAAVRRILAAALDAVDPYRAVSARLPDLLATQASTGRIFVTGAGKAAYPMALAVQDRLGERIHAGLVITKDGHRPAAPALARIQCREAAHPVPDARGVAATHAITRLLAQTGPEDLVVALISGGGSALLTQPAPGVTLQDLQTLTGLLLRSGATIQQVNTLRKHLDAVKGGGLARLAAPAQLVTLILSDVVGDPLDAIASGPTVPDPTTFQDAWDILVHFDLLDQTPAGIRAHLRRGIAGSTPETLKPGDPLFERVHNQVIASNAQAAQAALEQAERDGFSTGLLTTTLVGEARDVGKQLAETLRRVNQSGEPPRPFCLVAGGETTVTVRGDGLGGRNQELALGAVAALAGLENALLVTLATDGGDGPTDAAGAVASGETLQRAAQTGLDPADFLARNDAYHFFAPLGDLLVTGPTQTNVNDLTLLFGF